MNRHVIFWAAMALLAFTIAFVIAGCGGGDDKRENPGTSIDVSGDGNTLTVVDSSGSECSTGLIIRHFRQSGELINEQCAGDGKDEICGECFKPLEELVEDGFLSNEGCVEEKVLAGECGDEQAIEQAQAAASEDEGEEE